MKPSTTLGPAIEKACNYIRGKLGSGEWRQGDHLPSARNLARMADVSFSTIIKALAILKAEKLISSTPRMRTRAGDASIPLMDHAEHKKPAWLIKRSALEKDILDGMYSQQGKLPSCKELQAKYGVCFSTMRKILRSIAADGIVQVRGKVSHLRSTQRIQKNRRIIFVANQVKPVSALNQGQYKVLDELERECIRRDLALEVVHFDFYDAAETRRILAGHSFAGSALGYIVDLWWNDVDTLRASIKDILARLLQLKIPVAILDEIGSFDLPAQFAGTPMFQVFRFEDSVAGNRVARMLLGLGHRAVVYISFWHSQAWSLRRFIGIKEQYAKAGCGAGVHLAATDIFRSPLELVLAIAGWDDALIRKIVAATRTKSQAEDAFANYKRFKPPQELWAHDPVAVKRVVRDLGEIPGLIKKNIDPKLFDLLVPLALEKAGDQLAEIFIRPLIKQALGYHDATAWVCATDENAFRTLALLEKQGLKVPRDLSVVGFDNTPVESLEHRLTSYDFNAAGFIHRMLDYISRPPKPRGFYRHTPIEVEGIVMQRDTTAPAKQSKSIT